jgi:hypothetical protein
MVGYLLNLFAQHNECDDEGEEHGAKVGIHDEELGKGFRNVAEVVGCDDQLHDCEGEDYVGHVMFLSVSYSSCYIII